MSARFSTLARNGSNISSSSSGSSAVPSSNSHPRLSRSHTSMLSAWLREPNRYHRIATGTLGSGMAVLTREGMEQASDVRSMLECLPVAGPEGAMLVGWRKKLPTWPIVPKSDGLTSRRL